MSSTKKKRGCEIVVHSGDVFADGMAKIAVEIQEDLHRYLANPEAWFLQYLQTEHKLTEEDAMKIGQFFSALFSNLAAPFQKSTADLKTAKESKSIGNVIGALGGVVEVAAKTVEATSIALKAAGADVKSEDKHAMAKAAVVSLATSGANKLIDIPGVSEDQEENFFSAIFGGIVDVLIKSAVKRLNKEGWNL